MVLSCYHNIFVQTMIINPGLILSVEFKVARITPYFSWALFGKNRSMHVLLHESLSVKLIRLTFEVIICRLVFSF